MLLADLEEVMHLEHLVSDPVRVVAVQLPRQPVVTDRRASRKLSAIFSGTRALKFCLHFKQVLLLLNACLKTLFSIASLRVFCASQSA